MNGPVVPTRAVGVKRPAQFLSTQLAMVRCVAIATRHATHTNAQLIANNPHGVNAAPHVGVAFDHVLLNVSGTVAKNAIRITLNRPATVMPVQSIVNFRIGQNVPNHAVRV